jgi:hypothetical protein
MDTDAGKALLGSPNGRGVGYLLAEHKATFGQATVNKVTFYCAGEELEDYPEPTLVFHIAPGREKDDDKKRPNENPHEKPPDKEPPL